MATQILDKAKAESFVGKMVGVLNDACLALMVSVGHQTGLFDAMAELPPSTSAEIAQAAKLKERYVREWLGAMVTGGIVEYDPTQSAYWLPREHAAALTRAAGADNFALFMQYISLLGEVEQDIGRCFREGGGIPYSSFKRFQKLQAEETNRIFDNALVDMILPLVSGLVERLQAGIEAADVGCGCGRAINVMAKAFPKSRFVGYDMSEEGITTAQNEARQWGLRNARFAIQDAAALPEIERFDFITAFDTIHDQAQPTQALHAIAKALRRDGVFLMQDIAAQTPLEQNIELPLAPALYTFSTMHCMTVSLALNGEGLGAMWGEQKARQMLAQAGFMSVEVKQIPADPLNFYYIARKQ
ncbi:MAG: methyltransferase domain-containing protein [Acidobacteria bacterium]|nr:methyltransferase domain-containing protein [Acidobacteriota bacterium]